MLVRKPLGQACRAARQRAALTTEQIGDRAGVSKATISRLETGQHLPQTVEAIIEAYETLCGLPDGELWRRAIR